MLLYAITDRRLLPGNEAQRGAALVELARGWAQGGVDYIQIREKDLQGPALLGLTQGIVVAVREEGSESRVLVNGPVEIAMQAGADGVHLPGSAPAGAADQARLVFQGVGREPIVSWASHSVEEMRAANRASLVVFAPVFEKVSGQDVQEGVGLATLAEACRAAGPVSVIALGGVTADNAAKCIAAGAAGVAGIRLFLGDEWQRLR